MPLLDHVEEALAHRQTAVLDDAIKVEQHLAQGIDLRQIGHLRAQAEGRQLFQQSRQLLALRRMFAPAMQQILGIEQDIRALGQEQADHSRITRLALLVLAARVGFRQARLVQGVHALDELGRTLDRSQGIVREIVHTEAQQLLGLVQQLGRLQVHGNKVGLELLGHFLQRRGDFRNRQHARHVRAALERVQCALKVVGHWLRQLLGTVGQEADQRLQMRIGLVAKDLQQLVIEPTGIQALLSDIRIDAWLGCRLWQLSLCQRMGVGRQSVDVVALALRLGGKLIDQCRHQRHDIGNQRLDRCTRLDTAIEHTIEQILHRPGQFADDQCTHHAATALERMKSAPHFAQRLVIGGIGRPPRQILADGLQYFGRLFDEDFEQLLIDRFFIGRRR